MEDCRRRREERSSHKENEKKRSWVFRKSFWWTLPLDSSILNLFSKHFFSSSLPSLSTERRNSSFRRDRKTSTNKLLIVSLVSSIICGFITRWSESKQDWLSYWTVELGNLLLRLVVLCGKDLASLANGKLLERIFLFESRTNRHADLKVIWNLKFRKLHDF